MTAANSSFRCCLPLLTDQHSAADVTPVSDIGLKRPDNFWFGKHPFWNALNHHIQKPSLAYWVMRDHMERLATWRRRKALQSTADANCRLRERGHILAVSASAEVLVECSPLIDSSWHHGEPKNHCTEPSQPLESWKTIHQYILCQVTKLWGNR